MVLYYLEHERCRSRREVEALAHVALRIIFRHVALDHNCLGCSLLSNQQNGLETLRDFHQAKVSFQVKRIGHREIERKRQFKLSVLYRLFEKDAISYFRR